MLIEFSQTFWNGLFISFDRLIISLFLSWKFSFHVIHNMRSFAFLYLFSWDFSTLLKNIFLIYLFFVRNYKERPFKFFHSKALVAQPFSLVIWWVATLWQKFFYCLLSDHTGSNDTGLKTVSIPGAESIAIKVDKQIFFDIII